MKFQIRNPRSESYNATMGNDMTMDFKSKLGKFETPGKDNKKEASMDDAQNETPLMFFHDLIFFIFFKLLTMSFQIYLYISLQFQVGKSSNEPYNATMGNETTLDFKSKLEKIQTLRKDNDKDVLKDDPPDVTVVHVFSHQLSPKIFKRRKKVKKSHLL